MNEQNENPTVSPGESDNTPVSNPVENPAEVTVSNPADNSVSNPIDSSDKKPVEEPDKEMLKTKKFPYFEPIAGIFIAIVCVVVFVLFSDLITIAFWLDPPALIPTFLEHELHRFIIWFPAVLWGLTRIAGNVAYLIEKIYTKRLAIISLICNALTVILTFIIMIDGRIVNPVYAQWMRDLFGPVAPWFGEILARANLTILVILIIVMILDSITVVRKRNKVIKVEAEEENEAKAETAIKANAETPAKTEA